MITEDYILRMIQEMGQMLARILGSDALDPTDQVQPETLHAGDGLGFLEELKALCSHGQVNLAEDRLFEELDFSAPSALITVLGFYAVSYTHLDVYKRQPKRRQPYPPYLQPV